MYDRKINHVHWENLGQLNNWVASKATRPRLHKRGKGISTYRRAQTAPAIYRRDRELVRFYNLARITRYLLVTPASGLPDRLHHGSHPAVRLRFSYLNYSRQTHTQNATLDDVITFLRFPRQSGGSVRLQGVSTSPYLARRPVTIQRYPIVENRYAGSVSESSEEMSPISTSESGSTTASAVSDSNFSNTVFSKDG